MPTHAASTAGHQSSYRGRVLVAGRPHPVIQQALEAQYSPLFLPAAAEDHPAFLADHGAAVAVVVSSGVGVDADLLGSLPHLEAVASFGVGYDSHDVEALRSRGIPLSNTPGVLDECVADTALALHLDTLRRFSAAQTHLREEKWSHGSFPLTRRAHHRRVGILGLGRIGASVARRMAALDSEIHYWSRTPKDAPGLTCHPNPVELAQAVDTLVVSVVGGPETENLVSTEVLDALGADGVVINIARGSIVDDEALIAALQQGRVLGAGLDVFPKEPHVDPRYLELDNVVLYPHVGSATVETRDDMAALVVENLTSWVERGELVTPVA